MADTFKVPSRTDKIVYDAFSAFFSKVSEVDPDAVATLYGGVNINRSGDKEGFDNVINLEKRICRVITLQVRTQASNRGINHTNRLLYISLGRSPDNTLDTITFKNENPEHINNELPALLMEAIESIVGSSRTSMAEMVAEFGLDKHYSIREKELDRLQDINVKMSEELHAFLAESERITAERELALEKKYEDKFLQLEADYREKEKGLEQRINDERLALKTEYRSKANALEEGIREQRNKVQDEERVKRGEIKRLEDELEEKRRLMDQRSNEHARRDHLREMLRKLDERSKTFTLTKGTEKKRWPIHIACVVGFVALASIVGYYTYVISDIESVTEGNWPIFTVALVKQITALIGVFGLLSFYIKWNNAWMQEHADEEFRHQRLSLDISRAGWLVEANLDWQKATGEKLPEYLSKQLSAGLFESHQKEDEPSDRDLVSELMGASSKATLKLPNGLGELQLDRKGLEKVVGSSNK